MDMGMIIFISELDQLGCATAGATDADISLTELCTQAPQKVINKRMADIP
ncbi:hypothetical protein AAKU55_001542 [Oxalobacteraceae bacterium GrIS 1.11]